MTASPNPPRRRAVEGQPDGSLGQIEHGVEDGRDVGMSGLAKGNAGVRQFDDGPRSGGPSLFAARRQQGSEARQGLRSVVVHGKPQTQDAHATQPPSRQFPRAVQQLDAPDLREAGAERQIVDEGGYRG
jgi:hypothetical protein